MDSIFKWLTSFLFLGGIVAAIGYLVLTISGYFVPYPMCYIKIYSDTLKGNKETITKALESIRASSLGDHEMVCTYVNKIIEVPCRSINVQNKQYISSDNIGCYIKGSKVIYLNPDTRNDSDIIKIRAEEILRNAKQSRDYWLKGNY